MGVARDEGQKKTNSGEIEKAPVNKTKSTPKQKKKEPREERKGLEFPRPPETPAFEPGEKTKNHAKVVTNLW